MDFEKEIERLNDAIGKLMKIRNSLESLSCEGSGIIDFTHATKAIVKKQRKGAGIIQNIPQEFQGAGILSDENKKLILKLKKKLGEAGALEAIKILGIKGIDFAFPEVRALFSKLENVYDKVKGSEEGIVGGSEDPVKIAKKVMKKKL